MIGVLALQGAFLEHLAKFVQLGIPAKEVRRARHDETRDDVTRDRGGLLCEAPLRHRPPSHTPASQVRTPADLEGCDGLVIPGGESTAIGLIAERSGMVRSLEKLGPYARRGCVAHDEG